jgi:hypothetical protein
MNKASVRRIEVPDDAMCDILRGKSEAERLAIALLALRACVARKFPVKLRGR